MINWFVKKVLGTKNQREVKRLLPIVDKINALEKEYQGVMDEQLIAKDDPVPRTSRQGRNAG